MADAGPEYGKKFADYSLSEMRALLKREEQRLNVLNRHLIVKKSERDGRGVTADEQGIVKRVFTSKEKEEVKKVFDSVDTDNSGFLDIEELGKVIMGLGVPLGGVELLQAHKELDANGDGAISFDEFLGWWGSDISRSRYRGAALAQLRGRLNATDPTFGSSTNLHALRESGRVVREQKVKIQKSIDFGEFNDKTSTGAKVILTPGTSAEFKKQTTKLVQVDDLGNYLCNPQAIASDLWLSYRAAKQDHIGVAQTRFGIAKGKKQAAQNLVEMLKKEHHKQLAKCIAEEGLPEENTRADVAFQSVGIKLDTDEEEEWWSYESMKKFRELCLKLGKHMKVERNEEGVEAAEPGSPTLDEDSPEYEMMGYLQLVCDINDAYDLMPFVKFEVTDDEMIISVLVFVSNLFHEEIKAKLESVVEKDLEEYIQDVVGEFSLALGIGGDLHKQFQKVMEDDESWLEMLTWGANAQFNASYNPKIIESALLSNTQITNIMIPSFSAGMLKSFKQHLKVRNPVAKMAEIVDYYILDAKSTFASLGGVENGVGYEWGTKGEQQLEDIRTWSHFFLKSLKEKLRIGNPFFSNHLTNMAKKIRAITSESPIDGEQLDGYSHLQELKETLKELRGIDAYSPYFIASLTTTGNFSLMDPVPGDNVLKKIAKGTRMRGEDGKHRKECERRVEMLERCSDDDYQAKYSVLLEAIEYIKGVKGASCLKSKDGLFFVDSMLKAIEQKTFPGGSPGEMLWNILLGISPDGDDSDSDESNQHLGPRNDSLREGFTAIMRKASSIRLNNKRT